jgi:hypothetical protein
MVIYYEEFDGYCSSLYCYHITAVSTYHVSGIGIIPEHLHTVLFKIVILKELNIMAQFRGVIFCFSFLIGFMSIIFIEYDW